MTTIRVKNWDKWQSYRRDRGAPPWIKVYRNLFSKAKWASLSDAEKGQLVSIWLIAADKNGQIPSDPTILRKICQLDEAPNVNKFIELEFMESDGSQGGATVTPRRRQVDRPETETETETETEKKEGAVRKTNGPDSPSHDPIPLRFYRPVDDDWRKALFDRGLEYLSAKLDGQMGAYRSLLGLWLKLTGDDAKAVFDVLAEAETRDIADPKAWVTAALTQRKESQNEATRQTGRGGRVPTQDERIKAAIVKGLAVKLPGDPP